MKNKLHNCLYCVSCVVISLPTQLLMACVTENPYLKVLRGRIRNLRKNIQKLDRLEQMANEGVVLNPQQLESLRHKPARQVALMELEDILARMENISPEQVLSSLAPQWKEDPKESQMSSSSEQQTLQPTTELEKSNSSVLLETAVQSEVGTEELNKKQEEALVQSILTLLHVNDFIINEPDAVETIINQGLELPQTKFDKLGRLHLDSVNYFAKMLTSPDGDVPLEKALSVSSYHAMEYLQRSKKEAIPGITYDFLYQIVSVIASHPLLLYRGTNKEAVGMSPEDNIAEHINFFAQPPEEELLPSEIISNLQIGDSSIAISLHDSLQNSRLEEYEADNFLSSLHSNAFKVPAGRDNSLIISNEDTDSPLAHFISSAARDISLEESISRSVFADTEPLKNKSSNYQNGNMYRRNIDNVITDFASSEHPLADLENSSRENISSVRRNYHEVSFFDWAADEESHQTSEATYQLDFEPNSGMPKRSPVTIDKTRPKDDTKSLLKRQDDVSEERSMEQGGAGKLRGSRNRYSSRYGSAEGERNRPNGRQPFWSRKDRRNDSNGKQNIRRNNTQIENSA